VKTLMRLETIVVSCLLYGCECFVNPRLMDGAGILALRGRFSASAIAKLTDRYESVP
jgi:hypothetical protein